MNYLIEMFSALSAGKKISLVTIFAASISGLVVLFMWANTPDYQVLFSNLNEEDASQIIEELQNDKIQYKVSSGGTISVPREKVYETRLKLAGEGLTSGGGVGFEIFDRKGFGITEFVQKVNYTRALQGELARTISGLKEVEAARIHIVIPEKRLFAEDGERARASVVLKLKGGVSLKPQQVQGIVNLMAGSVSGLQAENVTVIDSSGKLLTQVRGDDSQLNMTSNQLEYQRQIEKGYEKRIHDILTPVVGMGKVIARVSAEIDFKRVQKTEETFDPDSVVIRSEQKNVEKSVSTGAGGIPGVLSSVPERGGGQAASAGQVGHEIKNETFNYEISKTISTIIEPTGLVKRLSVAVLVDGSYKSTTSEDGTVARNYNARTEQELAKFNDLVEGAVGLVVDRGDTLEVVNIPFDSGLPEEIVEEEGFLEKYLGAGIVQTVVRYATILIISLLILFVVLRPLIKGIFTFEPQYAALPAGLGEGELPTSLPPEAIAALKQGEEVPASVMAAAVSREEPRKLNPIAESKKRVREIVKENPQAAAHIIKVWLKGKGGDAD